MRAIRVEMLLNTANFRTPTSFLLKESYPLPPISTVIGMIHRICGFSEYHDMKVGIMGTSDGTFTDAYTMYSFKPNFTTEDRDPDTGIKKMRFYSGGVVVDSDGKKTGITKGLGHTETISNLQVVIYVAPKDEDFDAVLNGFKYPAVFPALGRHDDLANITDIKIVELSEDTSNAKSEMPMIVGYESYDSQKRPTVFVMHKEYIVENGIRRWIDDIKVVIKSPGETANSEGYMADKATLVYLF